MSDIILRVTALKIVNHGGGIKAKEGDPVDGKVPVYWTRDSGSDYVVWVCPHHKCGHRNKTCMYEAENYVPAGEDRIPFKCRRCRKIVEVERPRVPTKLIMDPAEFTREMAQRRKDLREHRPIMGRS